MAPPEAEVSATMAPSNGSSAAAAAAAAAASAAAFARLLGGFESDPIRIVAASPSSSIFILERPALSAGFIFLNGAGADGAAAVLRLRKTLPEPFALEEGLLVLDAFAGERPTPADALVEPLVEPLEGPLVGPLVGALAGWGGMDLLGVSARAAPE